MHIVTHVAVPPLSCVYHPFSCVCSLQPLKCANNQMNSCPSDTLPLMSANCPCDCLCGLISQFTVLALQPHSAGPGGDREEAEGSQGGAGEAVKRTSESPVMGNTGRRLCNQRRHTRSDTAVRLLTPTLPLPADAWVFAMPVCCVGAHQRSCMWSSKPCGPQTEKENCTFLLVYGAFFLLEGSYLLCS